MDDFFDLLKATKKYAAYPVVFTSISALLVFLVSLLRLDDFGNLLGGFQAFLPVIFGAMLCVFTVYYSCRSLKKAAASATSLLCADAVLFACADSHFSLAFCVVFALVFTLIMTRAEMLYGFLFCLIISVLVSVLFVLLREEYIVLLKSIAQAVGKRSAAFGVLDNVFNLFSGRAFEDLFYYKSYSAVAHTDGRVVTGAVDIFKSSTAAPSSAARYLTGRYFAAIFIPLGFFAALCGRLEKEALLSFFFAFLLSAVSGDERLFYLLLLLVSPILYVGALAALFLAYLVSAFVDIRIGFYVSPSVIELIKYMNKPVYFVITAIIITVLSYYLCKLIALRFGLLKSAELPRSVRRLVDSLGGRRNILKIENGRVIVSNPNLVDILSVDCDIRENVITLIPEDMDKLRKLVD